jgi:hypothetical protein
MINLNKLTDMNYRHFLISKALAIAVDEMTQKGDPNEEREIVLMQNLIDVEYPQFQKNQKASEKKLDDVLSNNMELQGVDQHGTKNYRFKFDEDVY